MAQPIGRTWGQRELARAASEITREDVSSATLVNWTRAGLLRPRRLGPKSLEYGLEDLFILILRHRLLAQGVAPHRVIEAMKAIRACAHDIIDPTQEKRHRVLVVGRDVALYDTETKLAEMLSRRARQLLIVLDVAEQVALVRREAERRAA